MNSPTEKGRKEGRKERVTIQGQFNRAAAAWNMISGQEYFSWVIEFQDISIKTFSSQLFNENSFSKVLFFIWFILVIDQE